MPRLTPAPPADSDLLCEACGYTLTGLPHSSRCPECGQPIAESLPTLRHPSPYETNGEFFRTSAQILFCPTRFFRTLSARHTSPAERRFARVHGLLTSLILANAVVIHANWYLGIAGAGFNLAPPIIPLLAVIIYFANALLTSLAARLSAWEAAYRGYRLPYPVVLRALHFHCAHYLPVAIVICATTFINNAPPRSIALAFRDPSIYLYSLCIEVILAAGYLFWTYWLAMRNLMYANG